MDLLKLYKDFGDRIAFMGGINVRALYTNDAPPLTPNLRPKSPP